MTQELERTCSALAATGADIGILASVANVTYVLGQEVPVPFGALAELTYAPWTAIIDVAAEHCLAVVPDFAASSVAQENPTISAFGFESFDSFASTEPRLTYLALIEKLLRQTGVSSSATIALETKAVPTMVTTAIGTIFPRAKLMEAESALISARWIKTDQEIERLRAASRLADIGHQSLEMQVQRAGSNEIDIWTTLSGEIFKAAGREIMLSGELVTGPRTTTVAYPNGPHYRETKDGEAALMDLSGRLDGYWFDCTNTHVIGSGEPTREQRRYAIASQDACEAAIAALKPGALASEAAAAAERAFAAHGLPMAHYAGHQIGVTVNELPRLVPYDHSPIEAGMVFSVEPGAYEGPGGTFGARSEKMVVVRFDGPEVLSRFEWGVKGEAK